MDHVARPDGARAVACDDVALLASLGRGAADFERLASALARHGFRAHAIEPPRSAPAGTTLVDLAHGVLEALDDRGLAAVHLVGHAFGNRLARMVTAVAPRRVATLTLLAAGGAVPMAEHVRQWLAACFDATLDPDAHARAVAHAFFAPGNDPTPFLAGWDAEVAAYQAAAVAAVPESAWWDATAARTLVVQGLDDVVAVPENGRRYAAAHPDVVSLVELERAGHALLVERPDDVASALVRFLGAG